MRRINFSIIIYARTYGRPDDYARSGGRASIIIALICPATRKESSITIQSQLSAICVLH